MKSKGMRKLTLKDFKFNVPTQCLSWKNHIEGEFKHFPKVEVCLERCLNGYDVAIYDLNYNLIGEKTCTDLRDAHTTNSYTFALRKAVRIANKKLGIDKEE